MQDIQMSCRHSWQGFTLIELLVTLALMGILAAWGLPSFQGLGERSAVTSEVNRLQTALTLARNTAITQRSEVTVCPANDARSACTSNWNNPVMVVIGDKTSGIDGSEVVRVFPPTSGVNVTKSGHNRIKYSAIGHATGFNSTYSICPTNEQTSTSGKSLVVSNLGRARVAEDPISCSDQ
ncbi:MAG: GspH/FimT family pseudopilin [Halomonas sp.]|nr:GspH/FimT family pseudopilin [Halomonas sp.]MBR2514888.1 GspH/FimT family pseudopilin [Halomonas sp.]